MTESAICLEMIRFDQREGKRVRDSHPTAITFGAQRPKQRPSVITESEGLGNFDGNDAAIPHFMPATAMHLGCIVAVKRFTQEDFPNQSQRVVASRTKIEQRFQPVQSSGTIKKFRPVGGESELNPQRLVSDRMRQEIRLKYDDESVARQEFTNRVTGENPGTHSGAQSEVGHPQTMLIQKPGAIHRSARSGTAADDTFRPDRAGQLGQPRLLGSMGREKAAHLWIEPDRVTGARRPREKRDGEQMHRKPGHAMFRMRSR